MASSYNGYALVLNYGSPQLMPLTANGKPFAPNPGILRGSVGIVMNYLADWLDANIEPLDLAGYDKDDWCYTQKTVTGGDGTTWSCHFSATAMDYNAQKHGQHRQNTWLPWQKKAINAFLSGYLEGCIIWGENWSASSIDGMHFEAGRNKILMDRIAQKILGSGPSPVVSRPTTPKPAPIPDPQTPDEDEMTPAQMQEIKEYIRDQVVVRLDQTVIPSLKATNLATGRVEVLVGDLSTGIGAKVDALREAVAKVLGR